MSSKNVARGRPSVDSERIDTRFLRSDIDAIDAFSAEHPDKPKRPEAIRRIVRDWLIGHGYLRAEEGD